MNLKSLIPVSIWLLIILIISGFPGNKIPEVPIWQFDKFIHSGVYAILSILVLLAFDKQYSITKSRYITQIIVVLISVSYGGFMEILQNYIFINRSGNLYDFIANTIGAIFGIFMYPYIVKLLPINKWLV